jgi:hypothetical protein
MKKIEAEMLPISAMSEQDARDFIEYVWHMRSLNMFDRDVLTYPKTVMLRAKSEDGNQLFIPMQSVLMFDSIAPKPGLSPRHEALALAKIGEVVDQAARDTGTRETYFFCKDDRVADLCARHGYEEIKGVRLLRKKVQPAIQ